VLDTGGRADLEREVRALCEAGEHGRATGCLLEGYGPEIFGYLIAVAPSEADATDAFSLFSEDLWRGLPGFRWHASARTWAYTIARNALRRFLRAERRHRGIPLSSAPEVLEIAEQVRTRTREYLRTEVKDEIAELRRELDPEDQALVLLHVGRKMSWNDVAYVLGGGREIGPDELKRQAARLRKRFERVKDKLAELVRARGLGRPSGP
jgi:RNA polymerase sigma-70 factor, ECF subfamily